MIELHEVVFIDRAVGFGRVGTRIASFAPACHRRWPRPIPRRPGNEEAGDVTEVMSASAEGLGRSPRAVAVAEYAVLLGVDGFLTCRDQHACPHLARRYRRQRAL